MDNSLLESLVKFSNSVKTNFFMPGHKFGKAIRKKFRKNIFYVDATEFDEIDNLQNPSGIIKTSQQKAAKIFKSKFCNFLTNGSTIGIFVMIMSACKRNEKIIVERNCHKSIMNAIILSGAIPIFIYPKFIESLGVYGSITLESIKRIFIDHQNIAAVLITSPTYYGVCSDIKSIAEFLHSLNVPLLVDEAHGAHFYFNKIFPKTAIDSGSDVCVQSTHKTLPSLTQTAVLNFNSNIISYEKLIFNLNLLQSTSPSYIFLTSIDEGFDYMKENSAKFEKVIFECCKIRKDVNEGKKIICLSKMHEIYDYDVTRLVFNFSNLGITGAAVSSFLKNNFGIITEMFDANNILLIPTIGNSRRDFKNLKRGLNELVKNCKKLSCGMTSSVFNKLPKVFLKYSPNEAFNSEKEKVLINKNIEGKICAEIILIYPPGSFISIPGQIITKEVLDSFVKNNITECTISLDLK
jgi:arginine/lysine/ornithine decarboxylase